MQEIDINDRPRIELQKKRNLDKSVSRSFSRRMQNNIDWSANHDLMLCEDIRRVSPENAWIEEGK
jgi:hypothetical protein